LDTLLLAAVVRRTHDFNVENLANAAYCFTTAGQANELLSLVLARVVEQRLSEYSCRRWSCGGAMAKLVTTTA